MPFPFDKYPWINFHELNLAYFIVHFREIFEQWDQLYHDLLSWKDATDADLAEWKSTVEAGITSWESGLEQSMEDWKDQTETDISTWKAATLSALDAWKTATTAVFEQIRTEAAASAQAAAGSAAAAQTALAGAQAAQAAAEAAAAAILSELAQIQTNSSDISELKTQLDDITESVYGTNRFDGTEVDGYLGENGVITSSPPGTAWKTTDFCYVGDLQDVCAGAYNSLDYYGKIALYYICEYDASKNFISRTTNAPYSLSIGNNTKYIRTCYDSMVYHDLQVQGGTTPTAYVPYVAPTASIKPIDADKVITNKATGETLDEALNGLEMLPSLFYTDYGKNRFDGITESGYLDANGNIHANASDGHYISTDFCYVTDLETICASALENNISRIPLRLNFLCFYTSAKTFISRASSPYPMSATLPENTAYVRFSYDERYYTQVQLESGETPTPYVAYSQPITKLRKENSPNGFLTRWQGIKWAAVGDSLTEVNSRTLMHYHDYVALESGISVYNMGVSGSGYAQLSASNKAFYQRISDVPTDTDIVTIFGSGNDDSSGLEIGTASDTGTSTICGCINTTIDNLYAIMPTVQLGIISPTPWVSQNPADQTNFMTRYSKALEDICTARGIPFLDLYHCSGLRPWESAYRELCYSKDEGNGVHPNELGHKIIAPHFAAFLNELIINY